MKKKTVNQMLALLMATVTLSMTACGPTPANSTSEGNPETKVESASTSSGTESVKAEINKEDLPTLSLYPASGGLGSGVVTGHKSDYFAENGGFQLEVWAYSDEKTNAILAGGGLPDIMYVKKAQLETMIEAGMVLDLEPYLEQMPHLYASSYMEGALENNIRVNVSAGTGGIYCLPTALGESPNVASLNDSTDRNGLKIRWDVYEKIGAPEIKDFWQLIDVMEEMVKAHPQEEDGTKTYGTILNSGSDSKYWGNVQLFYRWQGYDESKLNYLLEGNRATGEYTSILSKDSLYYEALKWHNEVHRRGLMDPDSINTDRATQAAKIDAGLAMVPSGTLPGWAPNYYEYYVPDTTIFYRTGSDYGNTDSFIVVNAETEHLEECLALLDMWCNPDAIFEILSGPDGGGVWYSDGEDAYFSDRYLEYVKENKSDNGYTFDSGEAFALWNTTFCLAFGEETTWGDGEGGKRLPRVNKWNEYMSIAGASENFEAWKKTTGYESWKEWLAAEDAYMSVSRMDYMGNYMEKADEQMQLTIDSIKDTVVTASWQMVYAETEEEFDAIWDKMLKDCEGLGAQTLIDWATANIDKAMELRDEAMDW